MVVLWPFSPATSLMVTGAPLRRGNRKQGSAAMHSGGRVGEQIHQPGLEGCHVYLQRHIGR
jgi:hypothetical protein